MSAGHPLRQAQFSHTSGQSEARSGLIEFKKPPKSGGLLITRKGPTRMDDQIVTKGSRISADELKDYFSSISDSFESTWVEKPG